MSKAAKNAYKTVHTYNRIDDLKTELNHPELKPLEAVVAVLTNVPSDHGDPVEVRVSANIETGRHKKLVQDTITACDGKQLDTIVAGEFSARERAYEFLVRRWITIVGAYAGTLATIALEVSVKEPQELFNVEWWLVSIIAIPIAFGVALTTSIKK